MTDGLESYRRLFSEEMPILPDEPTQAAAIAAAMARFEEISARRQETRHYPRLRKRMAQFWNRRPYMQSLKLGHMLMAGASIAVLGTLMISGPALHVMLRDAGVQPQTSVPKEKDIANEVAAAPPAKVEEFKSGLEGADAPGIEGRNLDEAVTSAARNTATPMLTMQRSADAQTLSYRDQGRDRFADIDSNPVKQTAEEPLSTFSIDTDTASYSFVRGSLLQNVLPPKDAVRVEEMVNYFPYDYEGPADRAEPFRANVTLMPTPWNPDTKLMQIGIRGFSLNGQEKPRSNLVFLVDTSGSMNAPDKLPLLVNSLKLLVDKMGPEDRVAIVAYAGSAGTVLEPTKASDKARILNALDALSSGGSTAGAEGIRQAYSLAERNFDRTGINRVILATDGDFNVGITDPRELESFVERKRESGVYLSVLGFGRGNYNDELMQTLAQNGNGNAAYIDTLNEARKVLVDEAGSTLFPIAKDVKIQVEFNPSTVSEYRLIGYETRLLNREDFNNDRIDAGEIGAGHTVTALYEVTPRGSAAQLVDPLRYGTSATEAAAGGEFAFVKIRYKLPGETTSRLITEPVTAADERASTDSRFAAAVAAFGQLLRGGEHLKAFTYDDVIALASANRGKDEFGYRSEFVNLVRLAKSAQAMEQLDAQ